MDPKRIEQIFSEFYFLQKYVDRERVVDIRIARMSRELLEVIPVDWRSTDHVSEDTICLIVRDIEIAGRVRSGLNGPLDGESVGQCIRRANCEPAYILRVQKYGWQLRVTIYKPQKGQTIRQLLDEQDHWDRLSVREQLDAIDATAVQS
jgi:hypothetical protein